MRITQTYQIGSVIFIGILASCHCFVQLQQTLTLPEQPPLRQDVLLILDNNYGKRSGDNGLFILTILLTLLTSALMIMPTKRPDGTMITPIQELMMPPQLSTPTPTTLSSLPLTTKACVPRTCTNGFVQVQTKCYIYSSTLSSWEVANMRCKAAGANLWEPTTSTEAFAALTGFKKGNLAWTGANDIVNEGVVRFEGSNNAFGPPPFGTVPPGLENTNTADCVFFLGITHFPIWIFDQCNSVHEYICEYAEIDIDTEEGNQLVENFVVTCP